MGIVFRIGGQSDIAARLTVAVVFGLGSVIVSYFLARELYGRWVGLASAVLLATMPYHVVVSRQVLVDTPMAFFALLGIYLAARAARRNSRRDLYLAFAACALAAISKEIAVLLIPVLVAWLRLGPARIPLIRFVGPSFVFAAIGLPFPLTRLVNQPSNASQFFLWQFARAPNHDADYFLNILFQFAGVGFVVALIVGIAGLVLCRSGADQLLLWWLVTFGLFFQFWPTKLFPYLFLILPAMVIAAVASLDRLGRYVLSARWQNLGLGAAVLALTMSFAAGSSGIVLAGPAAELEGFGDFDIEVQTFAGSREFGQWAGENTPDNSRFLTIGPSLGNILRFYGARDSVALSVSTNPERRNPAYVPIENPDLAMRQMSVHYVVWDAYSADRSAFYNNRLRGYARKLGGEIVFSAWAEGDQLRTEPGPPPDDAEVRIVVWDIPGAGSTTGGRREAGLS
ncbi:MAG: ArnT family glycosyltransferase, partial [Acidimicrobiales bacterium]